MKNNKKLRRGYLALALGGSLGMPYTASAMTLDLGDPELRARLDTTVSASTMWRLDSPGKLAKNPIFADANDGSLNFKKGSLVSQVYKVTPELQIDYREFGFFMRGTAWYDAGIKGRNPTGEPNATSNTGSERRFSRDAKNKASGGKILDAYLSYDFDIGDQPANVRIGRQVVNWGESIYYAEGLNMINPLDLDKFSLPGAQVKESVLPQNMIVFQTGITDSLSMEAFYQLEWKGINYSPDGTFFSVEDAAGAGSKGLITDVRPFYSPAQLANIPGVNGRNGIVYTAQRGADKKAKDSGQFGVAFRYLAEWLGDAEIGLYYMNVHSRIGLYQFRESSDIAGCLTPTGPGAGAGPFQALCNTGVIADQLAANALNYFHKNRYGLIFPENVRIFGLTSSGNVGSVNLAAELTYRPNVPVESDVSDLANAAATVNANLAGGTPAPVKFGSLGTIGTGGARINQYKRGEVYSWVVNGGYSFGRWKFFDDITAVAELAGNYHPGSLIKQPSFKYITPHSWGFNVDLSGRINGAYPNLILYPGITFKKDVKGNSRALVNHFMQGREQIGLRMGALYQGRWGADFSWNIYRGARDRNNLEDRDNIAMTLSYSF